MSANPRSSGPPNVSGKRSGRGASRKKRAAASGPNGAASAPDASAAPAARSAGSAAGSTASGRTSTRRGTARGRARAPAHGDSGRALLQRLTAISPDAIITVKAGGRIGMWSAGASRMTGRRRRDVQRGGLRALFRDPADLDALLAEIDDRGRVVDRELVLVRSGGEELPARVYGTYLKPEPPAKTPRGHRHKRAGARGAVIPPEADRYLIVIHDMTEVHHIRRRLIETEKLSAMAKIAGSVAHEFRNPLNSLFLNTDLLEDELEGKADIQEAIQPTLLAIREEIERLNQIITHYLSLSKIASSTPETLDLASVVDDFATECQPRAEERGFVLKTRAEAVGHPISADPNQVRRVMVNLVENAFDALDARDEAESGRAKVGRVTLILRRMRRSVKLTVKDNGPGIPADIRERVFEPFFTSKSGGSGLGLYLVREIVLAAGGSMSLSSADGRGTSVSVRWPLVDEAKEERGGV